MVTLDEARKIRLEAFRDVSLMLGNLASEVRANYPSRPDYANGVELALSAVDGSALGLEEFIGWVEQAQAKAVA